MGNFNRDNRRSGGGRSFGGGGRDFNRGPKQMFKAKCDECGKFCEVPFKPRGDKPIFCSECFQEQGGPAPFKPERRDRQEIRTFKPEQSYKKELTEISDKLSQIINLLKVKEDSATPAPQESVKKEVKKKTVKKAAAKTTTKKKATAKAKKKK